MRKKVSCGFIKDECWFKRNDTKDSLGPLLATRV